MVLGEMLAAPNTKAFGGVATGSIKAYEQHKVAGNIKNNGLMHKAKDCKKEG